MCAPTPIVPTPVRGLYAIRSRVLLCPSRENANDGVPQRVEGAS